MDSWSRPEQAAVRMEPTPRQLEVRSFLTKLQLKIVAELEALDGAQVFLRDAWDKAPGEMLSGGGLTCVLEEGAVFERGGVAFSDVRGTALPPSATQRSPHLAGRPYRAMGVSLVMHPRNPHAPTAHLNVRFFSTDDGSAWWFGGGYDLTPTYLYDEDVAHWHGTARRALSILNDATVARLRHDCDVYFTNQHRRERRGIGGIFYDDLNEAHFAGGSFEHCFELTRALGGSFLEAYAPLVERHKDQPFTEPQKRWQEWRRSRYVEFNLVWDRGTLFGLQSRGRAESILMSMPPVARWTYGIPKELGPEEQRVLQALEAP
jgi:coproporphyrinogen III oxidase